MKRRLTRKFTIGILGFILIFTLFNSIFSFHKIFLASDPQESDLIQNTLDRIKISDVSGTELYSEQISAYVAGSKSIIRQSLFTNDTNIFKNLDFNDPGFHRCNMLITASNGKVSEMFPSILSESIFGSQFSLTYNSFFGILLYDEEIEPDDAEKRAKRAFDVLKNAFEIELFLLNSSEDNLYPFIGYYPDWEVYLNRIYSNLPMDGYWGALDVKYLSSDQYLAENHLSSTILLIDSLDFLTEGVNYSSAQFDFDVSQFDLSFLEALNMTELFGGMDINELLEEYADILDLLGIENINETAGDLLDILGSMGTTMLQENNRFVTMLLQYEGRPEGITINNYNEYQFDLFKSMGYNGKTLAPSEKILIALVGTFLCEIDVNILSTDVLNVTPETYQFSDDIIEDLALLLWVAGIDFDIYSLKNYEFKTKWVRSLGVNRLYTLPYNPINETDIINYLEMIGFPGLPMILTGLLNPVESIVVSYINTNSEANLRIVKTLDNASYGVDRSFRMNVNATNVGNVTAWGIPTQLPIDMEQLLDELFESFPPPFDRAYIESIVLQEFGVDILTLLNLNEDPRIFQFDSYGIGIADTYYPDIVNPNNLMPYSEELVDFLDSMGLGAYAVMLNNTESIWNKDNWYLAPGESISYNISDYDISALDTYSSFAEYNFTIRDQDPILPAVIYGSTHTGTNSSMALVQDEIDWVIDSEELYIDYHTVKIDFVFENESYIDLTNNTLDRVRIYMNATSDGFSGDVDFYYWNYTSGSYIDISQISVINDTYTFQFMDGSINGLFDPASNNHTIIFRVEIDSNDAFNLSIDRIHTDFSFREIVPVFMGPASVSYSNLLGVVQYTSTSNTLALSTYNMASIQALTWLEKSCSKSGEINTLHVQLKNIGSTNATNVNFTMTIPGIIKEKFSFQVENNIIYQAIISMQPGETVFLNFTFYTPNSLSVPGGTVSFRNPKTLYQNVSTISVISNEQYLSAPVDYINKTPFLRVIEIDYITNNSHPKLYDFINLSISITNRAPENIAIPDIQIILTDDVEGLKRVDNNDLSINALAWNTTKTTSMILQKVNNKGYYFPPISFVSGSESSTIQINQSSPEILGTMNLEITKNASATETINAQEIVVSIKVVNTGTIAMENITLNDMNSYYQAQFSLIDGTLVNIIEVLDPGESATFYYTIYGKGQGLYNLSSATVDYYYLTKKCAESNNLPMKIIWSPYIQMLLILIPVMISLIVLGLYRYFTYYYRSDKLEKTRRDDKMILEKGTVDILQRKETLTENIQRINAKNAKPTTDSKEGKKK